jgi:hypothetical protein
MAPSVRKNLQSLHRQAAVGRYSSLADSDHGVNFFYVAMRMVTQLHCFVCSFGGCSIDKMNVQGWEDLLWRSFPAWNFCLVGDNCEATGESQSENRIDIWSASFLYNISRLSVDEAETRSRVFFIVPLSRHKHGFLWTEFFWHFILSVSELGNETQSLLLTCLKTWIIWYCDLCTFLRIENSFRYVGLMFFGPRPSSGVLKTKRTQRFWNWICFPPEVRDGRYLLWSR